MCTHIHRHVYNQYVCLWRYVYGCTHTHAYTHIFTWRRPPLLSSISSIVGFVHLADPRHGQPQGHASLPPPEAGGERPQPTTFHAGSGTGSGVGSQKPARTCGRPGRVAAAVAEVRVAQEACGTEQRVVRARGPGSPLHTQAHASGAHGHLMERGFHSWRIRAPHGRSTG